MKLNIITFMKVGLIERLLCQVALVLASVDVPNRVAAGFKLAAFQLQAAASPPLEECEGSHTQEEQYRLCMAGSDKIKQK